MYETIAGLIEGVVGNLTVIAPAIFAVGATIFGIRKIRQLLKA